MNNQINLRRLPTGKLNPANGQDVFAMLFELQKPLDNINLSIEMFRTVVLITELAIYSIISTIIWAMDFSSCELSGFIFFSSFIIM